MEGSTPGIIIIIYHFILQKNYKLQEIWPVRVTKLPQRRYLIVQKASVPPGSQHTLRAILGLQFKVGKYYAVLIMT